MFQTESLFLFYVNRQLTVAFAGQTIGHATRKLPQEYREEWERHGGIYTTMPLPEVVNACLSPAS